MTIIASDNFTDSDGTLLQSHTPSGGGSWTKLIGGSGVDIEIYGNGATGSGDGAWYYHSQDPTGVEYDVSLTRLTSSGGTALGQIGRSSTSTETGYLVWTVSAHDLYKVSSGSYTNIGSWATAPAVNDVVKLEIKDATKKVFVNGTERISSTNNDITAKGKAGIRCYGTSTTKKFDDWWVEEATTSSTLMSQICL